LSKLLSNGLASSTEVESGRHAARPELAKALAQCKRERAKLVNAKLDRLSRNVAFLAALMVRGVDFVARACSAGDKGQR